MDTITAIATRRSVKIFTGQTLSRIQLEQLVESACWAPTHRMTQPWRFYVCDQIATQALGERLATDAAIASVLEPRKAQKARELLSRVGGLVLVTWKRHQDPAIDQEDLAATAAAIQNLLLAATAQGLGSFWSTNPGFAHPSTLRWCGADPDQEGFVGAIWLGVPEQTPQPPARLPIVERLHWVQPSA